MAKQSTPPALRPRETIRPGMVRIFNTMGKYARDLAERPESEMGESIHGLRTLIKRLRAYLWFLRPTLGSTRYKRYNTVLRKAANRLGQARDLHAVESALAKAASPHVKEEKLQSLMHVAQAFAQGDGAQRKSHADLEALEMAADTVIETISDAIRHLKRVDLDWPSPRQQTRKAFKLTQKAAKKATEKKDLALVHEWRKKTKRFYYLLQLTVRIPKAGMASEIGKVDKLQDVLGDFQDSVVAENHLVQHPPEVDTSHIRHAISLLQKNRKILLKDACRHWHSILQDG